MPKGIANIFSMNDIENLHSITYEYEKEKGGFMGTQVAMLQGKELPSNRAYLDNCSTITSFKTAKYIY